jgi:outer membrane protein assembly factor BamB
LLKWISAGFLACPAFTVMLVLALPGAPLRAGEVTSPGSADLESLLSDLRGESLPKRVAAADTLGRLGSAGVPAVGAMLEAMCQPQEAWVAVAIMDGIKAMGPSAHPVVLAAFERGKEDMRMRAGQVLWGIGGEARDVVPRVRILLEDGNAGIRGMAEAVLRKIEEETREGGAPARADKASLPPGLPLGASTPTKSGAGSAGWPGFRGPSRDGVCTETGLLKEWPAEGPRLLWRLDGLGRGYSSIAIVGDRFYTMGDLAREKEERSQYVLAFGLKERRLLWAARVGAPHDDGGPRGTPTVDGDRVFALGTDGDLVCLEAASGVTRWQRNLTRDFGGRVMSMWKYCESPLVDGDKVICTPGGEKALLVALEKGSGKLLWQTAAPALGPRGQDGAGYASPIVAEIEGMRQYIQVAGRGIIAVEAETGRVQWSYNRIANDTANIPNPVVHGNLVFVANGYSAGSALLRIRRDGDTFQAEEVYFLQPRQFDNHHGGIVLVGDHVYGGVGFSKGDPACVDLLTGSVAWKARAPSSGSAAVLYADGHLIFRYDRGLVALVEASPGGYRLKGQFKALASSGPAWAYPVVYQRRLYLRHNDLLACYDLDQQGPR